jgi:hypothetical protein
MSPIDPIHVAPTAQRQTQPSRFGEVMRAAASGLADGLAATASLAAPFVPGGAILAGAVRGGVRAATGPGGAVAGGGGPGDLLEATRALQLEAQSFNLHYLQLQENMQRESREFQALSNVMKVKHDSAKAAINNIH